MRTGPNTLKHLAQVFAAGACVALAVTADAQQAPLPGESPPGAGGSGLPEIPHGWPLTPAQKMVLDLPTPVPGGHPPRPPLAADAAMPSADPHDLRGTWIHDQDLEFRMQRNMYGEPAPYNAAGAAIIARRVRANKAGTPYINASAICRPPGPQWQRDLNFPFQIFQTDDYVEFMFEEYHGRWYSAYDPKLLPSDAQYMGRSVARWDGDTLVIQTTGFKQALWLDVDGTPLSPNGMLTQRIRKVDYGDRHPFLEIVTTISDPAYYTKPWAVVRTFTWEPPQALFKEYNCEEQVGDPSGSPDAGLIPEPND